MRISFTSFSEFSVAVIILLYYYIIMLLCYYVYTFNTFLHIILKLKSRGKRFNL
jgi:hypothetical protein